MKILAAVIIAAIIAGVIAYFPPPKSPPRPEPAQICFVHELEIGVLCRDLPFERSV